MLSAILVIPHVVVLYLLLLVAAITTLISFPAVLVTGRYPPGLFNVAAAAVRYQARINAYIYLITHGYPPFSLS